MGHLLLCSQASKDKPGLGSTAWRSQCPGLHMRLRTHGTNELVSHSSISNTGKEGSRHPFFGGAVGTEHPSVSYLLKPATEV